MWKLILNEERNNLALLHVVQHCKRMRYILGAFQTLAASRCDSFHMFFTPIPIFLPFPVCFQVFSQLASRLLLLSFAVSLPPGRPSFPFQAPFPFTALENLSFSRPFVPANFPDPVLGPTEELPAHVAWEAGRGLEGRVPRSPWVRSDLAWSRAAGNWNCRSSSAPTALGCDWLREHETAGEWHCRALVNPCGVQMAFLVGFYTQVFEEASLTRWLFSFSGPKIFFKGHLPLAWRKEWQKTFLKFDLRYEFQTLSFQHNSYSGIIKGDWRWDFMTGIANQLR